MKTSQTSKTRKRKREREKERKREREKERKREREKESKIMYVGYFQIEDDARINRRPPGEPRIHLEFSSQVTNFKV